MPTPRGKIGRLPDELRADVNAMIRDNRTGEDIIAFLASKGVEGVTPQNVSNWKRNGYEAWAARQDRLQDMRARLEFATELSKECDGQGGAQLASDAASRLAVDTIWAALEGFSPEQLQGLLAEKPDKFVDLVHALSSIRQRDQAAVVLRMKLDAFQSAADRLKETIEEKGQATAEDFDQIYKDAYGTK